MTAVEIINEIQGLPPDEQARVIRFAYRLDSERFTGAELSALAARMAATSDPVEQGRLREEILRGFYGATAHAQG